MYLDKAKKEEIFSKYGKSNSDTGSAESQIALFSYRIAHLTEHVKQNRKDYTTTRALTQLVGKRRALLDYFTTAISIATVPSSRPSVSASNLEQFAKKNKTSHRSQERWEVSLFYMILFSNLS